MKQAKTPGWARLAAAMAAMGAMAGAQQDKQFAAEQRFVVPVQGQAPTIDGRIGEREWAGALQIDGFDTDQRRARGYVLATADALHFAVRSQLPDRGDLVRSVSVDNTDRLVFDDSIELWLDLHPGERAGQSIQLITNSNGNQWFRLHGRGGMPGVHTWEAACETRSGIHDGDWHCEVRIPQALLGDQADLAGRGVGVNLWRNWKNPWTQAFMIGSVFDRAAGNVWTFVDTAAPVVRFEERGDRFVGDLHLALVVGNPGVTPLRVKASMRFEQSARPETDEERVLEIAPGGESEVVLHRRESGRARCRVTAEVADADSGQLFFRHQAGWTYEPRVPWETPVQRGHFALQWRCGYFPSRNRLRVEASLAQMPATARVDRVRAVVREQAGGREIASLVLDAFTDQRQEAELELPADLAGVFEVTAWAEGENIPEERIVDEIRRHRFAWEGNTLGIADEVFPPFTPVRVDGDTVSVVLRQYRLNGFGLWASVAAQGQANNAEARELLAAPMRYVAVGADGAPLAWQSAGARLVASTPQRAVYESRAVSQAVELAAISEIEMDGMMRVTLRLLPVAGAVPLERLSLEIPLRDEHAWLMHEVGDALRRCYAGRIPSGDGVVWTSLETLRANEWLNAFTPYVWLGGAERGLCWFAENDKGWLTAKTFARPLLWLSRQDGQVVLRVDLVNVPGVVAAPTELVFGLQASPTKPMPDNYRGKWPTYQRSGPVMPWGGMSCAWKQPWDDLWEVVDKINESNLRPPHEPLNAQWFADFQEAHNIPLKNGEPWTKLVQHFAGRIVPPDHGHEVYFEEMVVLTTLPEYHVFQDEWNASRHAPRLFLDQHAMYRRYENQYYNPAARPDFGRSYVDYTLSLMNEWYRRGVSIKWDNVSPKVSDNPWVSAAYVHADGRAQPAVLLWNIRDYMRRTWNLMHHWRRAGAPRPLDFNPHMTNVLLLPWESWATMTDDLELSPAAYASAFPGRYDPGLPFMAEFLLTETSGRQVGTHATTVHSLFQANAFPDDTLGPAPAEVEKGRRELGMRLVHEIAFGHYQVTQSVLAKAVDAFGYGGEGVRVFNYWDDRPAFAVDHPAVKGILLARPADRRIVLLLQSWAPAPVAAAVTFDPAVIGFAPGAQVEEAFRRRHGTLAGGQLQAELDFPFAAALFVLDHRPPAPTVLFRDDFEQGLSFAWDYLPGYAEVRDGALRIAANRASWTGAPRVFNWLEMPDFEDGELSLAFAIGAVPAGREEVLSVRFPGHGVSWSPHGLSHSHVESELLLEVAADPARGLICTLKRQQDSKWLTLGSAVAGPVDTDIRRLEFRTRGQRCQVEMDGRPVLDLDEVPVPVGNAFQIGFARAPEKVGGLALHEVELRAAKLDRTRLATARREAAERSQALLAAARRDPLREQLERAFGAAAAPLLALRHFNRPEADVAAILPHLRAAATAEQRAACLALLRELPEKQREHVAFMQGIGQEPERLPGFQKARALAVEELRTLRGEGAGPVAEGLDSTIKALE